MLLRILAVVAVWGASAAFDFAVARWTRIGPVVLLLGRGHGVHIGDVVALAGTSAVATVATVLLLRGTRRSATGRGKHRPGVRAEA